MTATDNKWNMDFEKCWLPLLINEKGELDLQKIKNEFKGYDYLLEQVPKVYIAITNGKLSHPNYKAETVIDCFKDCLDKIIDEALKEANDTLKQDL